MALALQMPFVYFFTALLKGGPEWHTRFDAIHNALNDDFIASPLYCNAQNLAFCGNPLSIPSDVNISSYPNTMWGTRVRWEPLPFWYAMGGAYNAVAGFRANQFHGVDFSIRPNSGVIGMMETGVMPEELGIVPRELPGHVKLTPEEVTAIDRLSGVAMD